MKKVRPPEPDQTYRQRLSERGYTFRPTTDDWAPNFEGELVAVSGVIALRDGKFRICIWGGDDLGMEKDIDTKEEAQQLLASLPIIITRADLKERGFYLA